MSVYFNPNYTPATLAASQYSPGGTYAMSPVYTNINPAQQGQVSTGSGGGPNLLDLVSNGKDLIGSNSGGTGILGNVTSSINNFGGGLGFATTAPAATYTGVAGSLPWQAAGSLAPASVTGAGATLPWLSGGVEAAGTLTQGTGILGSGLGAGSTLSSTLGAAGLGAFAGGFLGRIGGNSTGGSIGGAAGAVIGNMIAPGIGGIIGGALGGIAGGFFGGKAGTQSDGFGAKLKADGSYDDASVVAGSKNPGSYGGFGKSVASNISSMLQKAHKELGIDFGPNLGVGASISTKRGGAFMYLGGTGIDWDNSKGDALSYDHNDPESYTNAMKATLLRAATLSGVKDTKPVEDWYNNTISGKNAASAYDVPFQNKQKFDDFMTKFKQQDTANVSPTTPDPTA